MSKLKLKKSSLFSRLLAASIICGTALGFTGEAFAKDTQPSPNKSNSLYFNEAEIKDNVYAVGNPWQLYGVGAYSKKADTTVTMSGEAISLTTSATWGKTPNYVVYAKGYHKGTTNKSATINLGGENTKMVALTGAVGIVAEGADSKAKATVNTAGEYLGIYATTAGVGADAYGYVTLNSKNIVINAATNGLFAKNNGNITVNGNLYVDAANAIVASDGGEVYINLDTPAEGENPAVENKNTTVLNGNLVATNTKHSIHAKLYGKDSSWTGNVATNRNSTIELALVEGATWNVVTVRDAGVVNTLILDGGFIEMRGNQGGGKRATAKVITLAGTEGVAHMGDNDALQVGFITNKDLSVYGGNLAVDTIEKGAKVTLNGVTLSQSWRHDDVSVYGTLVGTNVTIGKGTDLIVGFDEDTAGTATFTGYTTEVNNVLVSGGTYTDNSETKTATGTVTFNAKQTSATSLTAGKYGEIYVNGGIDVSNKWGKNTIGLYANSGKIVVNGDTEVEADTALKATKGGKIDVSGDIKVKADTALEATKGGKIVVNGDIKVKADTALEATKGGKIAINWDADDAETRNSNITVLKGDIEGNKAEVKVQLTGEDSYWTGNITGDYRTDIQIKLCDDATWNVTKVWNPGTVDTLTLNGGVIDMTDAKRATAKVTKLTGTEGTVYMDGKYNKKQMWNTIDTLEVSVFDVDDLTIYGGVLEVVDKKGIPNDCTIKAGDALTLYGTRITGDTLTVKGELDGKDITAKADIVAKNGGIVDLHGHTIKVEDVSSFTDAGVMKPSVVRIHADIFEADDLMTDSKSKRTGCLIGVNGGTATVDTVVANGGKIALQSEQTSADILAAFGGTIDVVSNLEVDGGKLPYQFRRVYSGNASIISANGGNVNVNTDGLDKTTLKGDIVTKGGNVNVNLNGADSSWTGNMVDLSDGKMRYSANITIGENAIWNVTKVDNVAAVTNLISNGGVIDLTEEETTKAAKVAKVDTLSGSKVTVNMDGDWKQKTADTLKIGTNENNNLTINCGILEAATDVITNNGVINLSGTKVNAKVSGTGIINIIKSANVSAKVSNRMNVEEDCQLTVAAKHIGNTVSNKGIINLYTGTLEYAITGGTIKVENDVTSAASNLAGNADVTISKKVLTLTGGTRGNHEVFGGGSLEIKEGTKVQIGDSQTVSYVAMDMTNVEGSGELTVFKDSRLYISGTLNHDIKGDGTTVLAEDIHVTDDMEIGTALEGRDKTIDMTNDTHDTLTIGKLIDRDDVNLKIDVATGKSENLESDKLTVNAAESGATINLTSVNITRDAQKTASYTVTYVDGDGIDKITYEIAGHEHTGKLYTYTSNYLYTIGKSGTDGQLSITRDNDKKIDAGEVVETALSDSKHRNATLSLTKNTTNTEGDISVKGTKEIYLNGYKLKSNSDSTITVSGSSTTLSIIGGRTDEERGTVNRKTDFDIDNGGTLNISGYTLIKGDVTNHSRSHLNIADGVVKTKGDVTGNGKATVTNNGTWIAKGIVQQTGGVELDADSILRISADKLQSNVKAVKGSEGGTVQLNGGTLKDDYTIAVGTVALLKNVTVESADSLENDTLLMNDNKITLKGGVIKEGMNIVGGGDDAKIIVDGKVGAEDAGVLTVNVRVKEDKSLTLYGGTLADGVIISGKGELVTDSRDGVTARVEDIQVKKGIKNKGNLTLTGDGDLSTDIYGYGNLTIAGTVDAEDNKITQKRLTIDETGALQVDVDHLVVYKGPVINNGELILTSKGELNERIYGNGTTVINSKGEITTEKTIKNNIQVNGGTFIVNGTLEGNINNEEGATLNLNTSYTNDRDIWNAGTLNVDVANLGADIENSLFYDLDHDWAREVNGTVNLTGEGTLEQKIYKGYLNVQGDITAAADNIAAYETYVADGKTLTLTDGTLVGEIAADTDGYNGSVVINGDVVAEDSIALATTVNAGKSLTIDADNVGAGITLEKATEGDELGKLLLGGGTLSNTVTGGKVELTGDVITKGRYLKNADEDGTNDLTVNLAGQNLYISRGKLDVVINNTVEGADAENGALIILGRTIATNKINAAVGVAETGKFTVNADNLTGSNSIENCGKLTLTEGTLARKVEGDGTTIISGAVVANSDILQNMVVVAKDAEFTIAADNLQSFTVNIGTLNLGEGTLRKAVVGDAGTTNITGNVTSEAAIAQMTVAIATGVKLTMANDATLTAAIINNGTLAVAAADLNGDVANFGKIELGRADTVGTLFKTITGGDVELVGNVATVGANLVNGEGNDLTVNLAGQNLYISKGDLDVVINNTTVEGAAAESGALVIQGVTTANKDINAAVGVAATGELTVEAGKLLGDKAVINYGKLTLNEGTFAREIEGTGTTTINGKVTANNYIWQNNLVVANDAELTMNGVLLANVNIAAKVEGSEDPVVAEQAAGILTISADNLKGAVTNNGVLNLTGGTFAGLNETYPGFVASIKGAGITNITEGIVYTVQDIIQKNINVENGATFSVVEGTKVATYGKDSKTTVKAGGTMDVTAEDIKGNVDNAGTLNFLVDSGDRIGRLNLRDGFNDAVLTNSGTVNFGSGDTDSKEFSIWSKIDNSGTVNIYTVGDGSKSRIHRDIVNTGTINTYGDITLHSNVSINGDTTEGTELGKLVINSGTLIFENTKEGSLNTNVEIKAGAALDPFARTLDGDITLTDYGTLIIQAPGENDGADYLAANIIADGKEGDGVVRLEAGTIKLDGGKITQKNGAELVAVGNAGDKPVITNVTSADQLNLGGGILTLDGRVAGTFTKNQTFALVTGDAVKDVVAQDLLTNKKLWKSVEMTDVNGNRVSNTDFDAQFAADYFLKDGKIVAELRTVKSIDEINTNGLAGVQQGAIAMTNQMNDKVAENMSLTLRPAAEKDQKYGKQIWASYINTKEDVDERDLWNLKADNSAKYKGAIVGVDFYSSKKAITGIALSYATGDITANTANRTHVQNDSKYYGVTLYDRVTNGNVAWTYDLGYQRGKNEISMNARENITADVKTNAITAGIRVECAYKTDKNSTFAPFASVRYTRLNTGDYTNSNGSEFDTDNQNLFIPKFGVTWKGDYGDSVKGWAFNPVVEVGFMFNAGNRSAETQYLSSTGNIFNPEYDVVDSSTYYGRVGMNFVNKKFSIGMDYRYLKGVTTKNSRWNINLGWSF